MPLAFESLSHGTLAFGFFNIESDMLLCDRYFFFADDFCRQLTQMADAAGRSDYETKWPLFAIDRPETVGDLMGAIHGVRFTGFIGAVYRQHRGWLDELASYDAFTDIMFNPKKSINCQGRSCAILAALHRVNRLEEALASQADFIRIVYPDCIFCM